MGSEARSSLTNVPTLSGPAGRGDQADKAYEPRRHRRDRPRPRMRRRRWLSVVPAPRCRGDVRPRGAGLVGPPVRTADEQRVVVTSSVDVDPGLDAAEDRERDQQGGEGDRDSVCFRHGHQAWRRVRMSTPRRCWASLALCRYVRRLPLGTGSRQHCGSASYSGSPVLRLFFGSGRPRGVASRNAKSPGPDGQDRGFRATLRRREGDSNPRTSRPVTRFPVVPIQPLWHLSSGLERLPIAPRFASAASRGPAVGARFRDAGRGAQAAISPRNGAFDRRPSASASKR